jgi:ribosome-binding ATPase YchF (GTP1/OBG family)
MCNSSCCSDIQITLEENPTLINLNIEEQPAQDITVIIDQTGITYSKIENFLLSLSSNFQDKLLGLTSNFALNSSNWQETYNEVNLMQNLTSGWQETYGEVNLMQDLTSGWQETYSEVNLMQNLTAGWQNPGIVDGGFF